MGGSGAGIEEDLCSGVIRVSVENQVHRVEVFGARWHNTVMLIRRVFVVTLALPFAMGVGCPKEKECQDIVNTRLAPGQCNMLVFGDSCPAFTKAPDFSPNPIASLFVREDGRLAICALDDAPIGSSLLLISDVENVYVEARVEIVGTPELHVDVLVPTAMNPGSVLVDSGRTVVALNTPIVVQGVPKGSTVLKADASVMWQNAIAGQVMASPMGNVAVGMVQFTSPGQATATVTINQDGVDSTFETMVFVKAPNEPLASATIRRVRNETGGATCTDDPVGESAKMSTCSWKFCVDASASRAKWTQNSPGPSGVSFSASLKSNMTIGVPTFVDPVSPRRAAICGNESVSLNVLVTEAGLSDELVLDLPT